MSVQTSLPRIDALSRPKQLPPAYREDRRSVYWVDQPVADTTLSSTTSVLTPRQEQLVGPKKDNSHYVRPKGVGWKWPQPLLSVSKAAQNSEANDYILRLAEPKSASSSYVMARPIQSQVTEWAKRADPSPRLELLSKAKPRWEPRIRDSSDFDSDQWNQGISKAALTNSKCTDRLEQLSEPKGDPRSYVHHRGVQFPVSEAARIAIATLRIQQLARPKSRARYDDYDPYKVTKAAKVSRASPRIAELAQPWPRKVKQKKIV